MNHRGKGSSPALRRPDSGVAVPTTRPSHIPEGRNEHHRALSMRMIQLTQGKQMLVDDEDYDALAAFRWHVTRGSHAPYASRNAPGGKGQKILAHRQLMPGCAQVDHANGDTLDNRRCNLRSATASQNQWNKGPQCGRPLKGVTFDKLAGKWKAQIYHDGRCRHLGQFATPEDAARAHDAAALALRGRFAWLNFAP